MKKKFKVLHKDGKIVSSFCFDAVTYRFYRYLQIPNSFGQTRIYKTSNGTLKVPDINNHESQCEVEIEGNESGIEKQVEIIEKKWGFKLIGEE